MLRPLSTPLLLACLTGCAHLPDYNAGNCGFRDSDEAWVDQSVRGWIATRESILGVSAPESQEAVVFDSRCLKTSDTVMLTGRANWTSRSIENGAFSVGTRTMPVGVVSATIGEGDAALLVMSTPTVWKEGGVPPGKIGLHQLMSAVFIHEATHVFQMQTYGQRIQNMVVSSKLDDETFNDDEIQALFQGDAAFTNSIEREIAMFFAAADAAEDAEAYRLAREAARLLEDRTGRYFIGHHSYQREAQDLWLTLEGSAQWAGYRWLILPASQGGAGLTVDQAREGFGQRGNYWTQQLGLAIMLTVERLDGGEWERQLFGKAS